MLQSLCASECIGSVGRFGKCRKQTDVWMLQLCLCSGMWLIYGGWRAHASSVRCRTRWSATRWLNIPTTRKARESLELDDLSLSKAITIALQVESVAECAATQTKQHVATSSQASPSDHSLHSRLPPLPVWPKLYPQLLPEGHGQACTQWLQRNRIVQTQCTTARSSDTLQWPVEVCCCRWLSQWEKRESRKSMMTWEVIVPIVVWSGHLECRWWWGTPWCSSQISSHRWSHAVCHRTQRQWASQCRPEPVTAQSLSLWLTRHRSRKWGWRWANTGG